MLLPTLISISPWVAVRFAALFSKLLPARIFRLFVVSMEAVSSNMELIFSPLVVVLMVLLLVMSFAAVKVMLPLEASLDLLMILPLVEVRFKSLVAIISEKFLLVMSLAVVTVMLLAIIEPSLVNESEFNWRSPIAMMVDLVTRESSSFSFCLVDLVRYIFGTI